MATSGTITGQLLAGDIIAAAFQELGIYSAAEEPTGEDTVLALTRLNWLLKSWQARGVTSWRDTDGSIVFPAGTATITLTPYCLDVTSARLVQASNYERPLQRWELAQYRQIPNKQQQGNPVAYSIVKTDNAITMTLWPIPVQNFTVNYSYPRIAQDVTATDQAIDIPQEWTEAVWLALASRLSGAFGVTRIDARTAQSVAQRAAALEQLLFDSDRTESIYLGGAYGQDF